MAFAPTKTFLVTDNLIASELLTNQDDIREYLEKLPANSLLGSPWVDTTRIMRGKYDPSINQATYVSGIYGGQTYTVAAGEFTYGTAYNTQKLGTSPSVVLPRTSCSFEIPYPCTLLFHWWVCPITRDNLSGAFASVDIFAYAGNKSLQNITMKGRSLEEDTTTANWPDEESRRFIAGTILVDNLGASNKYSVGLLTQGQTAKLQVVAWGFSCELMSC